MAIQSHRQKGNQARLIPRFGVIAVMALLALAVVVATFAFTVRAGTLPAILQNSIAGMMSGSWANQGAETGMMSGYGLNQSVTYGNMDQIMSSYGLSLNQSVFSEMGSMMSDGMGQLMSNYDYGLNQSVISDMYQIMSSYGLNQSVISGMGRMMSGGMMQ